jgi:hypothetical protein
MSDSDNQRVADDQTLRATSEAGKNHDLNDPAAPREAARRDEEVDREAQMRGERSDSATATATRGNGDYHSERTGHLIEDDRSRDYRERWTAIQAIFVDEPRNAVQQADELVKDLMKQIAETFGRERASLEKQWSSGEQVSTEQLRVALQRYRAFFERLLST